MTSKEGYNRTSAEDSKYFKSIPQETLEKIWGPKQSVKDIQKQHFSQDQAGEHTNTNEVEAYATQVEKQFHKDRKEQWLKGYMKNYISRNAKGMDLYKI
jgi:hypothetical protein